MAGRAGVPATLAAERAATAAAGGDRRANFQHEHRPATGLAAYVANAVALRATVLITGAGEGGEMPRRF